MTKIQFDTQFKMPYIVSYTEKKKDKNEFITDYVVKAADNIITIETRPKRKRFKIRLVEE